MMTDWTPTVWDEHFSRDTYENVNCVTVNIYISVVQDLLHTYDRKLVSFVYRSICIYI